MQTEAKQSTAAGTTSRLHLGVDVGGTFTKAVAVQIEPYRIIAQALIPTTHSSEQGVADGIVHVLAELLRHPAVVPAHVSLVAHSTTQAVNALLEGDTALVGIIGMGHGRDAADAARRTHVGDIPLAPGKYLRTRHLFIDTASGLSSEAAAAAVDELLAQGIEAIVTSEAFSVDDPANELLILDVAAARGIPAVAGHQLSGVYGLEVRTLTAAINASLLPKMLQTAELVEKSLRAAHIDAPLMVMRGDGGLTDLATLRKRPILTLLSGPAASLAGALLSGHVIDGVFLEVGGTSSNLGIIHGGHPEMRYVRVMNHPTCVRSLDVRVQGIAGGSLARLRGRKISDVGPRSAHIAGLPYASLSPDLPQASELELALIAPAPGDPSDYAIVRANDGRRWGLTLTCAANALGLVPAGTYAAGSQEAALRGFAALGRWLGCSAEDAARRMLDQATGQVAQAIEALAKEYKFRSHGYQLIGGGGGAGALVPAVARRLAIPYRIADHAEIISSLGDALASVREEVERAIGDATSIDSLLQLAEQAAIDAGADPQSVQVLTERDEERGIIRAVATGNVALAATPIQSEIKQVDAQQIVATAVNVKPEAVTLLAETGGFWVFRAEKRNLRFFSRPLTIVIDRYGIIRLNLPEAHVVAAPPVQILELVSREVDRRQSLLDAAISIRLLFGSRLLDLASGGGQDEIISTARAALARAGNETNVVAIIER